MGGETGGRQPGNPPPQTMLLQIRCLRLTRFDQVTDEGLPTTYRAAFLVLRGRQAAGVRRQVRENDRVELMVPGLNTRDHVDVGPIAELVGRLELDIEVKLDPSLGPVFRQVDLVAHSANRTVRTGSGA